jgi:hypothetical protein
MTCFSSDDLGDGRVVVGDGLDSGLALASVMRCFSSDDIGDSRVVAGADVCGVEVAFKLRFS